MDVEKGAFEQVAEERRNRLPLSTFTSLPYFIVIAGFVDKVLKRTLSLSLSLAPFLDYRLERSRVIFLSEGQQNARIVWRSRLAPYRSTVSRRA